MKKLIICLVLLSSLVNCLQSKDNKFKILEKVKNSVVYIETFGLPEFGQYNSLQKGTGFVVREDGLVLTNYHLVENAKGIVVYKSSDLNHPYYSVPILKDPDLEIAVLKVFELKEKPLVFADKISISIGAEVLIPGFIEDRNEIKKLIVTWGIISSDTDDTLSQTSAPINNWNSGSPVVNQNGEVVGIATGKIRGYSIEKLGLFLNSSYMQGFLCKIKTPPEISNLNSLQLIYKDSMQIDTIKIKDVMGTDNIIAYSNFCKAELYKQKNCENDSIVKNLMVLDSCKRYVKKAMKLDMSYSLPLYYYVAYNIEQQLISCISGNNDRYDDLQKEFTTHKYNVEPIAQRLKDKNSTADLIYAISQGATLDCDIWKGFFETYKKMISLSTDRIDEINNYFIFGNKPKILRDAINSQYEEIYFNKKQSINDKKFLKMSTYKSLSVNGYFSWTGYNIDIKLYETLWLFIELIQNYHLGETYLEKDIEKSLFQFGFRYDNFCIKYSIDEIVQKGIFHLLVEYSTDIFGNTEHQKNVYYYITIGAGLINNNYNISQNNKDWITKSDRVWGGKISLNIGLSHYFWCNLDYHFAITNGNKNIKENQGIILGTSLFF